MSRTPITPIEITTAPQTMDSTFPGTAYANVGAAGYTVIDAGAWEEFVAFVTLHQAPTGVIPTLDVRIEHSADGVNGWVTLADFAQLTISAVTIGLSIPGPGTSDPKTFARYIRFMAKVGGTTPVYTATIRLSPKE